ncbi:uncharacterized protein MELLADRAFT_88561 [Melampsora larici-populina 98AG31]|uniref:Uncharacterized protein n=1 Tax=Melampsora larici-populina (strain 98AG31 / pathotype 3-4-7) TaxID=747676 RepID=F4RS71_MELLP|nr:uncharacterized protein MELLADRAFT_88561 [Melampsora larici-populina 98AG31]EGG04806.1 hypothetical protein MELLADRAFT_88561 [Melampsora larici-populina 98AG31]
MIGPKHSPKFNKSLTSSNPSPPPVPNYQLQLTYKPPLLSCHNLSLQTPVTDHWGQSGNIRKQRPRNPPSLAKLQRSLHRSLLSVRLLKTRRPFHLATIHPTACESHGIDADLKGLVDYDSETMPPSSIIIPESPNSHNRFPSPIPIPPTLSPNLSTLPIKFVDHDPQDADESFDLDALLPPLTSPRKQDEAPPLTSPRKEDKETTAEASDTGTQPPERLNICVHTRRTNPLATVNQAAPFALTNRFAAICPVDTLSHHKNVTDVFHNGCTSMSNQ